jgi:hypothetical protein
MTPDDLERAKRHVRHVWEFFYHLMTYVLVNAILVIVDRLGGTSERAVLGLDWASWLIIAWGFGILGHAIYAFYDEHRVQRVYRKEQEQSR